MPTKSRRQPRDQVLSLLDERVSKTVKESIQRNIMSSMDKEWVGLAAAAAHSKMPDNHGFILLAVDLQPEGRLRYASNLKREDAVAVLKEWLIQSSGEEEWMKHIK